MARREVLLGVLTDGADDSVVQPQLKLVVADDELESVRIAALKSLGRVDDLRLAAPLIALPSKSESATLNSQIPEVLLTRRQTARDWLLAVDRGDVAAAVTPLEQIHSLAFFEDSQLNALVAKHWGQLSDTTSEQKLAKVRRLNNDL